MSGRKLSSAQSRRLNVLNRIERVQAVYTEEMQKHPCTTNKFVYDTRIAQEFNISERQFYRYLNVRVNAEKKAITDGNEE